MAKYALKINNRLKFSGNSAKDTSLWISNHINNEDMLEDMILEIDFDNGKFTTIDIMFSSFKLSQKIKEQWTEEVILSEIEKLKGFSIGG